jgi:GH15 family glucan-1,4-alpha-glucosidase
VDRTALAAAPAPARAAPVYPSIGDHALIGDCHTAALVSRAGAIDWCCLPRFDSDSCFGALLDERRGGHFNVAPVGQYRSRREYLDATLVLATSYACAEGRVRVLDFFSMRAGGRDRPRRELVRLIEGVAGSVRMRVHLCPRFDYGELEPWIYPCTAQPGVHARAHIAVGSNTALLISDDVGLVPYERHDLLAELDVHAGDRRQLAVRFVDPQRLDDQDVCAQEADTTWRHLEETLAWWHAWSSKLAGPNGRPGPSVVRSAITLKALTFAPTGAIVAAPTTSLPEDPGGERNWDYRYSWIRDSVFTVRALASLGCEAEADGFRRFIQRSAAGHAKALQVLYGIDGRRRLTEVTLDHLEGWRGSRPVRVGNAADKQFQADMYGMLLELSWRWSERGNVPDDDYWEFLARIVEAAVSRWERPDHGIWEIRDAPRHFVHSKVSCWGAVHRGLQLAQAHGLPAPLARWRAACTAIRETVMREGVDHARGVFVAAFGRPDLDAALLLLPAVGFVDWRDPLMLRTADAIHAELSDRGLILRYRAADGLRGDEGVFLPCSFWLAECFARQGRMAAAHSLFERACACANDLGLFAEEYWPAAGEALGNFPQGLTHLSHVAAALALAEVRGTARRPSEPRAAGESP